MKLLKISTPPPKKMYPWVPQFPKFTLQTNDFPVWIRESHMIWKPENASYDENNKINILFSS